MGDSLRSTLPVAALHVVKVGGENSEKIVSALSGARCNLREKTNIAGVPAQRGQERLDGNEPAGGTRRRAVEQFTERRQGGGGPVTSDGHTGSKQRGIGRATGALDGPDLVLRVTNRCFRFVRLIGSAEG